ncbi:thiolase family protein [Chloroflexota bacterium]
MREVVIAGVGMHRFGRFPENDFVDLATHAVIEALKDASVEWKDVQSVWGSHSYGQTGATNKIIYQLGLTGIPVFNVELGCSGGSAVVGMAYQAIASGFVDIACAVGFEKMAKGILPADEFPEWMTKTGIAVYPAMNAWAAQTYMREYGLTKEHLAKVAIKSHNNAALNPYAHYQDCAGWTIEQVLNARMIADPLTLTQIAPVSEGAAAAILCTREVADKLGVSKPVSIAAYSQKSGIFVKPFNMFDWIPIASKATQAAAKEAYEQAGCGPDDLDIVQCHDAYTIAEIIDYENLGLCAQGEGWQLVEEGATELTGRIPVNTDGGMMSRGNALGACALACVCETVWQLRGEAGKRQIEDPKIGLTVQLGIGPNLNILILKK